MEWHLFLNYSAWNTSIWIGLLMLARHINAFHQHLVIREYTNYRPSPTLIFTSDHNNFITLFNFSHMNTPIYKTSGAREIIFMNLLERNSRVTGPKIRVPIGSCLAFRRTAAFPSNLIEEPSDLRTPCGPAAGRWPQLRPDTCQHPVPRQNCFTSPLAHGAVIHVAQSWQGIHVANPVW